VNKHLPHLFVLPEDRANTQLTNGFQLEMDSTRLGQMKVLEEAGGWRRVLEQFESVHAAFMDRCPNRFMVLLIDFDSSDTRLDDARNRIPERLRDRVFILGAWNEPEDLKRELGTYEEIGSAMARDCREETDTIWGHELLRHNAIELARMRDQVRPILF
jgi:hypothetical protein